MPLGRSIAPRFACVSLLLLVSWGCEQDGVPPGQFPWIDGGADARSGSSDADAVPTADGRFGGSDLAGPCDVICGARCVDTSSDRLNCGACNRVCSQNESCRGGTCGMCVPIPLFGSLAAFTWEALSKWVPKAVVIADVNDDGIGDVVSDGGFALANRNGRFDAKSDLFSAWGPAMALAAADFDADGRVDFLSVDGISKARETITRPQHPGIVYLPGAKPLGVAAADFDGDRHADALVANSGGGSVTLLRNLNDGEGKLSIENTFPVGTGPGALVVSDWNADGKPDVAVANAGDAQVAIVTNQGGGVFGVTARYGVGKTPVALAAADLDGDGDTDLVVANRDDDSISVLFQRGDGTLSAAVQLAAGSGPQGVTAGDFDGDGKPDIAVALTRGGVAVLRNQGGGQFAPAIAFATNGVTAAVASADFDSDGKWDLAVALPDAHALGVLMSQAGGCL